MSLFHASTCFEHMCSKHVEAWSKLIIKFSASSWLTLWRRDYFFFLILAHPVYKMWIVQEPNKLALWNKLHFEEEKTESVEHV